MAACWDGAGPHMELAAHESTVLTVQSCMGQKLMARASCLMRMVLLLTVLIRHGAVHLLSISRYLSGNIFDPILICHVEYFLILR